MAPKKKPAKSALPDATASESTGPALKVGDKVVHRTSHLKGTVTATRTAPSGREVMVHSRAGWCPERALTLID